MRCTAIYSDHTVGTGGGENFTCTLAAALATRGPVDLFVRTEAMRPDPALLANTLGATLDPRMVTVRVLDSPQRLRGYDLFFNVSHFTVMPPLARRNVLVVFFPQLTSEWVSRYDAVLAISHYTADWIERYWNVDRIAVAYPTFAADRFRPGPKAPVIVSVGRFFRAAGGNTKNHDLMIRAFRQLVEGGLLGWRLLLVGASYPDQAAYVAELQTMAQGLPVSILTDLSLANLRELYARAAIYWHAAGLSDAGLTTTPSAAEHFGITILEAMAAGAVPVIAGIGGAAEIVQHGHSGLLARTTDELVEHTRMLAEAPGQRDVAMGHAIARAREFAPAAFTARVNAVADALSGDALSRAEFWRAERRFRTAADAFSEVVDEYAGTAGPYFGLADCLFRTGRRELALSMWRRGLEIDGRPTAHNGVRSLVARIETQAARIDDVRSGRLFDETYFQGGEAAGVSGYTEYDGNAWAGRHAEAIDGTFSPTTCLDVGCAKGEFVRIMRSRGVHAFGTDLSQFSVTAAEPPERGAALAAASMAALPFRDDAFDLVIAVEVLEHVPPEQVDAALAELWRTARHYVFVTVQNTTAATPDHFFADLSHCTMKTLDWWRDAFRRAGFEVLATELPLGEFVQHQIVARPMGKCLARGQAAVDAEWHALERGAHSLVETGAFAVALRTLRRALTLAEHAHDDGLQATPLRAMSCAALASAFERMGWADEAAFWRGQSTARKDHAA